MNVLNMICKRSRSSNAERRTSSVRGKVSNGYSTLSGHGDNVKGPTPRGAHFFSLNILLFADSFFTFFCAVGVLFIVVVIGRNIKDENQK